MAEAPDPHIQDEVPDNPSATGGNTTVPFDEEAYAAKVEYLEGVLREQTEAGLSAERTRLITTLGGHRKVEGVNVWEAVKKQSAMKYHRQVGTLLTAEKESMAKPAEDRDVFDTAVARIVGDRNGPAGINSIEAGPDIVDFVAGFGMDELAGTPELEDPEVLAKATRTIRLLVAQGQYKLNQWGRSDQLRAALDLMTTYTEWVPGFDPHEAGFDEAVNGLTLSLAALQVDDNSKSNYRYAYQERGPLMAGMSSALQQLRVTEAHRFLQQNDIVLPPEASQPTPTE